MATFNRFNGESSGCRTPDPLGPQNSGGWAKKGADTFEDDSQDDAPGDRTPDRVANLNIDALKLKLEELQASVATKCAEHVLSGASPGLSPSVENCLEGDVMKVVVNSNLTRPFGATASSSLPMSIPPPLPESGFVRPTAKFQPAMPSSEDQVVSKGSVGHPFQCAPACKWVKRKGGCQLGADCPNCHYCFWSKNPPDMQRKPKPSTQAKPELFPGAGSEDEKLKEAQSLANRLVALLGGEEPFGNKPKESKASVTTTAWQQLLSVGHPQSCAVGCMFGGACMKCHACLSSGSAMKEAVPRDIQVSSGGAGGLGAAAGVQGGSVAKNLGGVIKLNDYLSSTPPVLSTKPTWTQPQEPPPQKFRWQPSVGSTGHPHSCGPACKYAMKPKGCKDGRLCSHCHLCRWMRYGVKTADKQPIEITGLTSY